MLPPSLYHCVRMVLRRATVLLVVAVALATLTAGVDGLGDGLLHLAPALLLALCLRSGRYVGEEQIALLAEAARAPRLRWPRAASQAGRGQAPQASGSRGGELLAVSLAQRGPPSAVVVAR